ncbi:hypothetical protein [Sphingomonas abietis]|uniref:Uncharacterized protein n=1 Tax=Sphingomonas abietis TaxID=3012344 RepID=A0ABY7NMY7_9SPHN|nr:hypothetical protein [Sphingomonas abietis]WBO22887.1 hypothetical protein PBT88_01695 [Sphingomonas abietis]
MRQQECPGGGRDSEEHHLNVRYSLAEINSRLTARHQLRSFAIGADRFPFPVQ